MEQCRLCDRVYVSLRSVQNRYPLDIVHRRRESRWRDSLLHVKIPEDIKIELINVAKSAYQLFERRDEMKKRNLTFVIIAVLCVMFIAVVALLTGRKEADDTNKSTAKERSDKSAAEDDFNVSETIPDVDIDYSGFGNEQGNLENGGDQTYLENRGILLSTFDDTGRYMLCFDDSAQELQFFCNKSSCLHNDSECVTNQILRYLLSYSSVSFGVPENALNEIWKCQNNELSCFYRSDNDIYGIWGYGGYIYFMTDFGVSRVSIDNPATEEAVLDRPVLYEYLTFNEDKMYFCEEDRLLYQANLDGSEKQRFCDEKLVSPQICDGYLYYRSAEFDENGQYEMKNTLKSISLKDKKEKTIIDEVYQFNVDTKERKIYYIELPTEDSETTLNVINLDDGKANRITDCASAYLYIFPQSDWIVFEKYEGELEEGEVAGKPTHLYCIKKDGSEVKRLDYPKRIEK